MMQRVLFCHGITVQVVGVLFGWAKAFLSGRPLFPSCHPANPNADKILEKEKQFRTVYYTAGACSKCGSSIPAAGAADYYTCFVIVKI